MGTDGRVKVAANRNNKGISLVYVAILIFVLVLFVGFGVDMGYMFVAKGQLQNAADAASLAGAKRLNGGASVTAFDNHSGARREAWRFACRNRIVPDGTSVFLATTSPDCNSVPVNLNNGNDADGDIVVGHWNANGFKAAAFGNTSTINAVKVVARRTSEVAVPGVKMGGNPVTIFFSKLFGWSTMSARAEAVAFREPAPVLPISLCIPRCGEETIFTEPCPGKKFLLNPPVIELECGFAWANLTPCPSATHPACQPPTPKQIRDYLENPLFIDICNQCIRTKQGGAVTSLDDLQAALEKNKTGVSVSIGTVQGWEVLIPVLCSPTGSEPCPDPPGGCGPVGPQPCPGDQPNPYRVIRMAKVILTKVDTPPSDDCIACTVNQKGAGITLLGTDPVVGSTTSTKIRCFACDDPNFPPLGSRVRLVK